MPTYEYQCQGCGFIVEADRRIIMRDISPHHDCPIDEKRDWNRIPSVPAPALGLKFQNEGYPYLSQCRDWVRDSDGSYTLDKNGQPRYERVVFESQDQQNQFMDKHDLVQYETPVDEKKIPEMPAHVKAMEDHPCIRQYLDQKNAGKIPEAMVLSEAELLKNFDVELSDLN